LKNAAFIPKNTVANRLSQFSSCCQWSLCTCRSWPAAAGYGGRTVCRWAKQRQ